MTAGTAKRFGFGKISAKRIAAPLPLHLRFLFHLRPKDLADRRTIEAGVATARQGGGMRRTWIEAYSQRSVLLFKRQPAPVFRFQHQLKDSIVYDSCVLAAPVASQARPLACGVAEGHAEVTRKGLAGLSRDAESS